MSKPTHGLGTTAESAVFNPAVVHLFRRSLLLWYDGNMRDLPWRINRDPYRVWISEIMLQQTRVAAVLDYYARFLQRFPDVHALARARESSVLALWSGLGYYRRARSLHAAARIISREKQGRLPSTPSELAELPGIGSYTAAAIASIAFNHPCAVVDGNVERVLQRLTGKHRLAGKSLWHAAQQVLSPQRPGAFNQAMMELGATLCLPDQPVCSSCPVARWCTTRGPVPRRAVPARKRKQLQYVLTTRSGSVCLVRRPAGSLMPGMWELPAAPPDLAPETASMNVRHSITDTDYRITVYRRDSLELSCGRWVPLSKVAALPLTGLARKILRKASLI